LRQLFSTVFSILSSIKISLIKTISALGSSVRHRRTAELVSLLKEGSPLESLIDSVASAAFWVLALAPVLLVPVYYLLITLK
jgi:hypothetical protein